jgi:hypothetical protein
MSVSRALSRLLSEIAPRPPLPHPDIAVGSGRSTFSAKRSKAPHNQSEIPDRASSRASQAGVLARAGPMNAGVLKAKKHFLICRPPGARWGPVRASTDVRALPVSMLLDGGCGYEDLRLSTVRRSTPGFDYRLIDNSQSATTRRPRQARGGFWQCINPNRSLSQGGCHARKNGDPGRTDRP